MGVLRILLLSTIFVLGNGHVAAERGKLKSIISKVLQSGCSSESKNTSQDAKSARGCWLSRFMELRGRSVKFQPTRARPTPEEADVVIEKMVKGQEVVEVPGFKNMNDFTAMYEEKIIKAEKALESSTEHSLDPESFSSVDLPIENDSRMSFVSKRVQENFCQSRAKKTDLQARFFSEDQQMAFPNGPYGLAKAGVCWWHARFQRNALYLASYQPDLPKPSQAEAEKIIKKIRKGRDIVEIPGFASLKEFSAAYQFSIVDELEDWQRTDSFVKQRWVTGMSGKTKSEKKMKDQMDEIHNRVKVNGEVTFVKVQLPGVTAHSLLIGDIQKTSNGYIMKAVDSNDPNSSITYVYKEGDESLGLIPPIAEGERNQFVPYVEFTDEVEKLEAIVIEKCEEVTGTDMVSTCSPNLGPSTSNELELTSNVANIFNQQTHLGEFSTITEATDCSDRSVRIKDSPDVLLSGPSSSKAGEQ